MPLPPEGMVGALGVFGPTFLANPIDKLNRWAHSAPMPNDEITTREALDILGLAHPSSITHLVAEHKLKPSRRMPGKRGAYLFRRAHIERLRDERDAASGAA